MTSRARSLLIHAGQAVVHWRERPARALAWAGGAIAVLLLALAVVAMVTGWGRGTGSEAAYRTFAGDGSAADAWHYLLVCTECGYRTRSATHPAQLHESRGGQLQCPACGRFAANWFRRGSLAVPPGGWDVAPDSVEDTRETTAGNLARDLPDKPDAAAPSSGASMDATPDAPATDRPRNETAP